MDQAGCVRELTTGYVALGDSQRFPGYTLLLCKTHATELHHLPPKTRDLFLHEMAVVAEAVDMALHPDKLNYALLGAGRGLHMHWHIFHRRAGDTPRPGLAWQLPTEETNDSKYTPTPETLANMKRSRNAALDQLLT